MHLLFHYLNNLGGYLIALKVFGLFLELKSWLLPPSKEAALTGGSRCFCISLGFPEETDVPKTCFIVINMTSQSNVNQNHHHGHAPVFTFDLPYQARKGLCDILDADGSWRQLAGEYMNMSDTQITLFSHALFRGASPSNDLLVKWEQSSPRISTLFRFLYSMNHLRAILILKPFVSEELQRLCDGKLASIEVPTMTSHEHLKSMAHPTSSVPPNFTGSNNQFALSSSSQGAVGGMGVTPSVDSASLVHNYVNYEGNERKVINSVHWNDLSGTGGNDKVLNQETGLPRGSPPSKPAPLVVQLNDKPLGVKSSDGSLLEGMDNMDIMYKELMLGTDDFSQDRVIGSGGFGIVYRGELKGTQVAIKRLKGIDNVAQAINEFKVLNRYRIDNIVPLYGISLDGPEACIVYQYMPNGSLEDKLLGKGPGDNNVILSWNQRAHIGEGIAKGVELSSHNEGKTSGSRRCQVCECFAGCSV